VELITKKERDRDYLELKRRITQAGLLERQYGYYAWKIPSVVAMVATSVAVMILFSGTLWVQMLNAVFLALTFTNLGFLGHDSGHRQIFIKPRYNDWILLGVGFMTGMTPSWWQDKHNTHHRAPNQMEIDGDIEVSLFAFSQEQAMAMKGLGRFTARYQAFLFYPLLMLTALSLLFGGIAYQIRKERMRYPIMEPVLVVAGLAAYLTLIFAFLGPWHGALFIAVHRALGGVYMGSVFAPNHKGMPMMDEDVSLDYLRRQVVTARNINPNPVTDFCYGGLNYQIEHHLFAQPFHAPGIGFIAHRAAFVELHAEIVDRLVVGVVGGCPFPDRRSGRRCVIEARVQQDGFRGSREQVLEMVAGIAHWPVGSEEV